jgi:hypothetical protein
MSLTALVGFTVLSVEPEVVPGIDRLAVKDSDDNNYDMYSCVVDGRAIFMYREEYVNELERRLRPAPQKAARPPRPKSSNHAQVGKVEKPVDNFVSEVKPE